MLTQHCFYKTRTGFDLIHQQSSMLKLRQCSGDPMVGDDSAPMALKSGL